MLSLKRYLWALGTVGSSAPFVGLFGTVVGILKAFQSMSVAGTGGFKVVSQGIAAALVATAAGLLVAIYAVIAYNYFVARVNGIAMQYKLYCEEFLTALGEYARRARRRRRRGARRPTSAPRRRPAAAASLGRMPMGMNVQLDDGASRRRGRATSATRAVVAEINITPLTDVFLVLLIIFMVTSTALVESEVGVARRA